MQKKWDMDMTVSDQVGNKNTTRYGYIRNTAGVYEIYEITDGRLAAFLGYANSLHEVMRLSLEWNKDLWKMEDDEMSCRYCGNQWSVNYRKGLCDECVEIIEKDLQDQDRV